MKTISQKGLSLIKKWEGLELEAYRDTGKVWTIGYGHTHEVRAGQKITPEQAEQFLREDLQQAESAVNRLVKKPLRQQEYDALVSFVFNIGEGQFKSSTMLKMLNKGDMLHAASQFMRWTFDNRKFIQGLEYRRRDEMNLFLSEDSND